MQPDQSLRPHFGHKKIYLPSQVSKNYAENPSKHIFINNNIKMVTKHFGRKKLTQIIYNRPNMVTSLRIVLIYFSIALYNSSPRLSCSLMIFGVLLGYAFRIYASNNLQQTFSGDCFSWLTAVLTHTVTLLWWVGLQPELIAIISTLLMIQIITLLLDLIAKSYAFRPQLKINSWTNFIAKNTMNCKSKGYDCKGLGSWNEIFYFLCIISRILYLKSDSNIWLYLFIVNFPLTVAYLWMNLAYVKYILDSWNEGKQNNRIILEFRS